MFKNILLLVLAVFLLTGCDNGPQRSGIEVDSMPASKIFIDGKEAGSTPYRNRNLKPGRVTIRLVPDDSSLLPWENELMLRNFTDTVLNIRFSPSGNSDYQLSLEPYEKKNPSVVVTSEPSGALVRLGDQTLGYTPLKADILEEGENMLKVV